MQNNAANNNNSNNQMEDDDAAAWLADPVPAESTAAEPLDFLEDPVSAFVPPPTARPIVVQPIAFTAPNVTAFRRSRQQKERPARKKQAVKRYRPEEFSDDCSPDDDYDLEAHADESDSELDSEDISDLLADASDEDNEDDDNADYRDRRSEEDGDSTVSRESAGGSASSSSPQAIIAAAAALPGSDVLVPFVTALLAAPQVRQLPPLPPATGTLGAGGGTAPASVSAPPPPPSHHPPPKRQKKTRKSRAASSRGSVAVPSAVTHNASLAPPHAAAAQQSTSEKDARIASRVKATDIRTRNAAFFHGAVLHDERHSKPADPLPSAAAAAAALPSSETQEMVRNYDGQLEPARRANSKDTGAEEELADAVPHTQLDIVLAAMDRRRAIKHMDLADAIQGDVHLCKLCGFMDVDEEKHNVTAIINSANESSGNALLGPSQSSLERGQVEDYVYADISRIVAHNLARCNEWDCCKLAELFYYNNAYRKSGGLAPMITAGEIYAHFFGRPCVLDPRFQLVRLLRRSANIMSSIESGMVLKNAVTGEEFADPKQVKAFSDMCKTIQGLYTWNTKDMRFFAPELPVDTDLTNALIVPGHCIKKTAKKQRHGGIK